jgi:predicted DNA-binding transcriptional regulator AlpA
MKAMLPETGFIRLPVVLSLIPISKSALYDGIRKGLYPPPVKLSARTSAWRVEDIRSFIEKKEGVTE